MLVSQSDTRRGRHDHDHLASKSDFRTASSLTVFCLLFQLQVPFSFASTTTCLSVPVCLFHCPLQQVGPRPRSPPPTSASCLVASVSTATTTTISSSSPVSTRHYPAAPCAPGACCFCFGCCCCKPGVRTTRFRFR